MAINYVQSNNLLRSQRYHALSWHSNLMGIDYVKPNFTDPNVQPSLTIYFIPKLRVRIEIKDVNNNKLVVEAIKPDTIAEEFKIKINHDPSDITKFALLIFNNSTEPEEEYTGLTISTLSNQLSPSKLIRIVNNSLTMRPVEEEVVATEVSIVAKPTNLSPQNFKFTDTETDAPIQLHIDTIEQDTNSNYIKLNFSNDSLNNLREFTVYCLELINITYMDQFFSSIDFTALGSSVTEFDLFAEKIESDVSLAKPEINYLAKDYLSFRNLMLNRLSVLNPAWDLDNPADMAIAMIEVLAYSADQLSYYQDAVATEAYLGTARQRISVKRHARLLDYIMHEGVNARVWVQVCVNSDDELNEGTQLLTRVDDYKVTILPGSDEYKEIITKPTLFFETLYKVNLYKEHNEIQFYTWGSTNFVLSKGSTAATLYKKVVTEKEIDLNGEIITVIEFINLTNLKVGDILIFKEAINPSTGLAIEADRQRRHAVRLTKITFIEDKTGGYFVKPAPNDFDVNRPIPVVEIEWDVTDTLPFDLIVAAEIDGQPLANMSLVLGNIVLADHGKTETNGLSLSELESQDSYQLMLPQADLTFRTPYDVSLNAPASTAFEQDPRLAYPMDLILQETNGKQWLCKTDLLDSQYLDNHFVVEVDNDKQAILRFGDNIFGVRPSIGTTFQATYRIGNGTVGNIGAESLGHIVTEKESICGITNPLPARGGIDAESIEQVRLYAPVAFKQQKRCVTLQDYIALAKQHPEVKSASATMKWNGSWYVFYIAVIRKNNLPIDQAFKNRIKQYINEFKLIRHDIEIIEPKYVALDISLVVHIKPDQLPSIVRRNLATRFSNRVLTDGILGFFHPDNFDFGDSVYLSQIINEALKVPGVDWIDVEPNKSHFRIFGASNENNIDQGFINTGNLEIIRVDNNISRPEYGIIEFMMES